VILSQSGRILTNTATSGAVSNVSSYGYDAAGRLVTASIPRHQLTYSFANASCGAAAAGRNGNRTSSTDAQDGGAASVATSCYVTSDRLLSTTVSAPPVGATPTAQTISAAKITYDAHGNTTRLADQVMTYDSTDRHMTTVLDDGSKVVYQWDVTDRIVKRTPTPETHRTPQHPRHDPQIVAAPTWADFARDRVARAASRAVCDRAVIRHACTL